MYFQCTWRSCTLCCTFVQGIFSSRKCPVFRPISVPLKIFAGIVVTCGCLYKFPWVNQGVSRRLEGQAELYSAKVCLQFGDRRTMTPFWISAISWFCHDLWQNLWQKHWISIFDKYESTRIIFQVAIASKSLWGYLCENFVNTCIFTVSMRVSHRQLQSLAVLRRKQGFLVEDRVKISSMNFSVSHELLMKLRV